MLNINIHKLSRSWCRQLHAEFEEICWKYGLALKPPIFEITNSKRQLGAWLASSRTIKINSSLILTHSWNITISILKHEIAHQICSEMLSSKDGHGADFQNACVKIGLSAEFRRAKCDLSDHFDKIEESSKLTKNGRRFIAKIEKLLALASSTNEHEASLAAQKANELIEKYQIRQLQEDCQARYSYVTINRKRKRIETYQRHICAILSEFFFVRIVNSYLYDPRGNQTHKTIEILGTTENVSIAEYCYYFLDNQLASNWSQKKHRFSGSTRTEKNSYYLGLLNGFYQNLKNQKKKHSKCKVNMSGSDGESAISKQKYALISAEDHRLDSFVRSRFPRLRKFSRTGSKIYGSTYGEGIKTGRNITLHNAVTHKQENKGILIGNL